MKLLFAILGIAAFSLELPTSWGQAQDRQQRWCAVAVPASVEVAGEEFSLADLLAPATCSDLRQAAAGVHLGRVPLAGSARVLTGDEVRALLQKVVNTGEKNSIVLHPMLV